MSFRAFCFHNFLIFVPQRISVTHFESQGMPFDASVYRIRSSCSSTRGVDRYGGLRRHFVNSEAEKLLLLTLLVKGIWTAEMGSH